jgi:hypothetical protein
MRTFAPPRRRAYAERHAHDSFGDMERPRATCWIAVLSRYIAPSPMILIICCRLQAGASVILPL